MQHCMIEKLLQGQLKESLALRQCVSISMFRYLGKVYLYPSTTAFSEHGGKRPFIFLQLNVSVMDTGR